MKGLRYWAVHFAGTVVPTFSGIGENEVIFDKRGLELLLDMGGGARSAALLNVTATNCEETVPQVCGVVEEHSRRLSIPMRVNPRALICSFCESHRRGGLSMTRGGVVKRIGFSMR